MFDFLKKRGEVPDVGQEEDFDKNSKKGTIQEIDLGSDSEEEDSSMQKVKNNKSKNVASSQANQVQFSRIGAKLESLDSFAKALNERLSAISQQIGELRAMNLNNEKSVSKATQEAIRTIEIVREVRPENLRADYPGPLLP